MNQEKCPHDNIDRTEICLECGQIFDANLPSHKDWQGITHFTLWDGWLPEFVYSFWEKTFCKLGLHLFDEIMSCYGHCLYCDACGLTLYISRVEKEK